MDDDELIPALGKTVGELRKRWDGATIVRITPELVEEHGDDLVLFTPGYGVIFGLPKRTPQEIERAANLDALLDELVPLINADETPSRLRTLVRELIAFFAEEDRLAWKRTRDYMEILVDAAAEDAAAPRRMGAIAKMESDPLAKAQSAARADLRKEWDRWQRNETRYENDEDFGRKMHAKARYAKHYRSERSISNLSRKWRGGSA